ncbi:hypothetical protein Tco_0411689 [Tanacetum coccineum]
MSGLAELNLSPPTSAVRNTVRKGNEQISKNLNRPASDATLREYYDKHYHQLLPIIAEKIHQEKVQQEKLKEVKARLNFKGGSRRNSKVQEVSQHSESRTPNVRREHRIGRSTGREEKEEESREYVELLWEDFIYQIDNKAYKKQEKMYYHRFTKVIIHYFLTQDKTVSWRNKIGMHTSRDDYLINTLRFVSAKEATQIYGAILPESLTCPEMKETKAYKTYLGFATGATPPKIARKFKKTSPSKKDLNLNLVLVEEEPKSSKKKVSTKKTTRKQSSGVVLRDTPVESSSKRKEKVDVTRGKGIELLSEVALTKEAHMKEVRQKSMRDFHMTHPIGSGTFTEIPLSVEKIKPSVTSEETGDKPGVPDENKKEYEDDEVDKEEEFVKTPSDRTPTDDEDETYVESKVEDKAKGVEDEKMDYTTSLLYDDVDVRLNNPFHTNDGSVQKEGTDAEITNFLQGNENLEIKHDQVIKDGHVTTFTAAKKTEVLVTSSSHSSDLASKFLNFTDIPLGDAEIISPMDVPVHHEVPSTQTHTLLTIPVSVITTIPQSVPSFTPPPQLSTPTPPPTTKAINPQSALPDFASVFQFNNRVSALEKEVAELKKDDPLKTQVTALVDEHLDIRLRATREEFMSHLSASITAKLTKQLKKILINKIDKSKSYLAAPEHRECYDGLIKSYELDKTLFSTYDKVYSLKRSREDKDKDEDPSAGSDRGLKKRKTSKDAEPSKGPKTKESNSGSSKGTKSQSTSFGKSIQDEEPKFEIADSDIPQDQEGNKGNDDEEPKKEVASKRDWFTKPKQPQEPTDPDWNTFDDLMSTPIDFSTFIMNGLKINNLTQETLLGPTFKLLKGTHTNYAELEYDFEECYKALLKKLDWNNLKGGDYPFDLTKPLPLVMSGNRQKTRAAQYDLPGIEDMVLNIWSPVKVAYDKHALRGISLERTTLTNLSGNDVSDFAIALRMFTRSMVIQKRVKDLQLGVESYQKKINLTKPDTTRLGIKKRDPFTPYQDHQVFIYVDSQRRNMLIRSNELYKFSDGTLTRLRSLLEDITRNIHLKYLPKRR